MRASWKWIVAGLLLTSVVSWADVAPPEESEEQIPQEQADAPTEPPPGVKPGPAKVELGHELTLDVPEEHVFLEKALASQLMEKNGSFHNENLLGMVVSKEENAPWAVVIRYDDEGYIKDDEKLDAQEILDAIKEGQEEANQERVQRGFPALRIGESWTESPHYDRSLHHLVWALDVSADDGTSINYNTRVLGRRGYVSLNLVVGPESLDVSKPQVVKLLQSTAFKTGSRYEDYQQGSDKVAEYGLAGIVLGGAGLGAAKLVKIGLLAKASKFILALLVAGKKVIVIAVVALLALLKKLFGGKGSSPSDSP